MDSPIRALTPYELLGGESVLRQLVHRFYEIMDTDPHVAKLRAMHKPDLHDIEEKLFMFLSGWMGGPSLYIEKYGHPRLRQRHMIVKIGEEDRDQWMYCMIKALKECPIDPDFRDSLIQSFWNTADFMRNDFSKGTSV